MIGNFGVNVQVTQAMNGEKPWVMLINNSGKPTETVVFETDSDLDGLADHLTAGFRETLMGVFETLKEEKSKLEEGGEE